MDIKQSIGRLEASNQTLASASDKHAEKLDALAEKVHTNNGTMKALGWVLSAVGAIGLLLLGTILTVLLKHFNLL